MIDLRWFRCVVTWREHGEKCFRCARMLGHNGKGYLYERWAGNFELCRACHRVIQRRSLRQFRLQVSAA